MPHCPSCKAEIDHLDSYTDERHYFAARLPKEGDEANRDVELYPEGIAVTEEGDTKTIDGGYSCPKCMAEVADTAGYAATVLRGY